MGCKSHFWDFDQALTEERHARAGTKQMQNAIQINRLYFSYLRSSFLPHGIAFHSGRRAGVTLKFSPQAPPAGLRVRNIAPTTQELSSTSLLNDPAVGGECSAQSTQHVPSLLIHPCRNRWDSLYGTPHSRPKATRGWRHKSLNDGSYHRFGALRGGLPHVLGTAAATRRRLLDSINTMTAWHVIHDVGDLADQALV